MKLFGTLVALCLTACLPQTFGAGGYTQAGYYHQGTGVYLNGQELTAQEKAQLDHLIGDTVPPGRYFVDANGNAGPEGGPPMVNLYALAQQRGDGAADTSPGAQEQGSTQFYGQSGTMTSVGDCIMVSTPGASFDTGC